MTTVEDIARRFDRLPLPDRLRLAAVYLDLGGHAGLAEALARAVAQDLKTQRVLAEADLKGRT